MDKETRNLLQRATQRARNVIEVDFQKQLEGTFDIRLDVTVAAEPGAHLDVERRLERAKLVAAVEHFRSGGLDNAEAVTAYLREATFSTLNRFVALKMLEPRGLVQECISRAEQSSGFKEFTGLAPGLVQLSDHGYRLYIESLFDEIGREVRVLFDRRDPASLLWPRRQALVELFTILNAPELAEVWSQDETIGWVYQYFNGDEERRQMRAESQAPRNSRELAVRNQFFTPRYVVEFLTDNTLGRIWYDMRQGKTRLAEQCDYLVRRRTEVFLQVDHIDHFAHYHPGVRDALSNGDFSQLPVELGWDDLEVLALGINGDEEASRLGCGECCDLANETLRRYREQGVWEGDAAHLWCCLFFEQRRWRHFAEGDPQGEALNELQALYGKLRDELQTDTSEASQEELLRRPVFIPPRKKKDPRDIRILDPACGSGHFLLYAFDLLITMYEEAWQDHDSPRSEVTGRTLSEDHATIEGLHLAVPGLILRHNLHGIDIDPRAAQIAALALWMRSQRAYNDFNILRSDRPRISKTNIVVAEPMPGEQDLLDEFVAPLERRLGALVKRVFEKMELAGEAGSLLKIEEEIQAAVGEVYAGIGDLFQRTDEKQWLNAEEQLLEALGKYAEYARNGRAYRRRLFAEDAERGLGFIDLCRQSYDVAVMNPPFGEPPGHVIGLVDLWYRQGRNDLYAAFMIRALGLVRRAGGIVGAITSRSFITGRDHRHYRRAILSPGTQTMQTFLDLGSGVLDHATVETCAYTVGPMVARSIAVLDLRTLDKPPCKIGSAWAELGRWVERTSFTALPECDFLYDLTSETLERLAGTERIEPGIGRVTFGLTTKDDSRFVRLRWEVPEDCVGPEHTWTAFAKGGEYSWFSGETHLVVKQRRGIEELAAFADTRDGNIASTRRSSSYYYRAAVCFSRRSQKGFSARRLRRDACFSDKSGVVIPEDDQEEWLFALGPTFASLEYQELIKSQSTFGSYEIGPIKRLPRPPDSLRMQEVLWREAYRLIDQIEQFDETSQLFVGPPAGEWSATELMRQALRLVKQGLEAAAHALDPEVETAQLELAQERDSILKGTMSWLSYLVGVVFGRWDPRFPALQSAWIVPGPFDASPRFAPGRNKMSVSMCEGCASDTVDVAVDDPGHSGDLAAQIFEAISAFPETLGRSEIHVTHTVDDVRMALRSSLFGDCIKRYSKSRRKAPIYWQLATPSASYSVWLYYHRLTKDTFYKVLNDYVTPKLQYEERKLTGLLQTAGPNPDAGWRKEIREQETFVQELRAFREEVSRIAPLWNPALNDGVIINFALLWRLVPQQRAWQKECKDCWDKLVTGGYDWSHLAMHLWPEMVVPKCTKDRSLALAHGLENVFWFEADDGKWKQREVAEDAINNLIAERTSPAVKEALKSLLEAPATIAIGSRSSTTKRQSKTANRKRRNRVSSDE